MTSKNQEAIPVRIALVGGGSLGWGLRLMSDLALEHRLRAEVRLYDLDQKAAQRNARIGARLAERHIGPAAQYTAVPNLQQALSGADIVIISILPGTLQDMGRDVGLPACYGIPQSVGDTVGPAGFFRALRAIPMAIQIADAIEAYAPTAFVCNVSNPISVITGALYSRFPQIRAWGASDEVTKIRRLVAHIANQKDAKGWHWSDVDISVAGLSHFTFVEKMALGGHDMRADFDAFVSATGAEGWPHTDRGVCKDHERYFGSKSLVGFDLFRRFGVPAAAGDRHLAEFLPVRDYLADHGRWGFALTPMSWHRANHARRVKRAEALAKGETVMPLRRSDTALVSQIVGLMGGTPAMSNANLPNMGQMPGLPQWAVVETNARFARLGITPLLASRLPIGLETIIRDHALRQSGLVQAVMRDDPDSLFDLFRGDPLLIDLKPTQTRNLFGEMMRAAEPYLSANLRRAA